MGIANIAGKLLRHATNPKALAMGVTKSFLYIKNYGIPRYIKRLTEKVRAALIPRTTSTRYQTWIRSHEPSHAALKRLRASSYTARPLVSVFFIAEAGQEELLPFLRSLFAQTYETWEALLPECATLADVRDPRVRTVADKTPARFFHEGVMQAKGEIVLVVSERALFAPFALHEIVTAWNNDTGYALLYSDSDAIDKEGGIRSDPLFRPAWNPDMFFAMNYVGGVIAFSTTAFRNMHDPARTYEHAFLTDAILRATRNGSLVRHIPKVLYHVLSTHTEGKDTHPFPRNTAEENAARKREEIHVRTLTLEERGEHATVTEGHTPDTYCVRHAIMGHPRVTIIIPNKDAHAMLSHCIRSIREKTTYHNYDILIVENGSREDETFRLYDDLTARNEARVITWKSAFSYAAINNFAAGEAEGEMILFLNNDTEVITPDWLTLLVEHAARNGIGGVGAKLYYPNDTIQHAGVLVGVCGIAVHHHAHVPRNAEGYMQRLLITQNVSAVTGACFLVRKHVFTEAGGFDERLAVAFNDIDLCLSILEKGYRLVWTPYAELYHYESISRGYEDTPEKLDRFYREARTFEIKWKAFIERGDPFYNPNLSKERGDFTLP